jgi:hypothetical protein
MTKRPWRYNNVWIKLYYCTPAHFRKSNIDRDEASSWIRWMKSTPAPCVVDLSSHLGQEMNAAMGSSSSSGMLMDDALIRKCWHDE